MLKIIMSSYILGCILIIVAAVTKALGAVIFTTVLGIATLMTIAVFMYRHYKVKEKLNA